MGDCEFFILEYDDMVTACIFFIMMPVLYPIIKQQDLYDLFGLKDRLVELIQTHEYIGLCEELSHKPDLIKLMVKRKGYMVLYREACLHGNIEALNILERYGVVPDKSEEYHHMGEYDMWLGNPLSISLTNSDVDFIEKLLNLGFKASCPGCSYSGLPEVCVVTSAFRDSSIPKEGFARILRASNPKDAIASFENYLVKDFDENTAYNFLDSMCKSVPSMYLMDISITKNNKDFVMGMVDSGILDIDNVFCKLLDMMLGYTYNFFYSSAHGNIIKIDEIKDCIKHLIFLGADTQKVLRISSTLSYTDLFGDSLGDVVNMNYTRGSAFDILGSSLKHRDITVDTVVDTKMCTAIHIENLFFCIEEIYKYIRYTRRQGFVRKRIRGIEEGEVLDYCVERFLGIESHIFARIVTYIM